jgi:hypothetical protein
MYSKILLKYMDMRIVKVALFAFTTAVIIHSCDCLQHVHGIVIDAETQLPLENALIKKAESKGVVCIYTDSLGCFDFTAIRGALFSCPKISLSFEKKDYIGVNKEYKSCCTENVVIDLKKAAIRKD